MKEENCSPAELHAFVDRAVAAGARELMLDIDYDYPDPSPAVVRGLSLLRHLATMRGIHTTFGSTGSYYNPEVEVAGQLERAGCAGRRNQRFALWVRRLLRRRLRRH